ncbi:M16 family metallopeptidase [Marinomonas rhizomae]|uniref:Zinc protease n=1 Tax=Marinomonas rhizomae TaxID=491948 RepID=A0A366J9W5_9GAMM|nr:M16 family metallopeptidase [Marinomonas rhizomae]RBP83169.1 zinc protease [Marinomonas rhizomae]
MFFRRIWFNATHVALLFLLSVLSSIGNAQDGVLGWDKRVVHGTLDNGFRYYLFDSRQEKDTPKGLTLANLVVLSGAIDEEKDQLGVAHMVEHMVFHESDDLPNGVRKAFTDMGFKQGRDFNAMTNSENTRYMVNLKNSTPERLNSVLDIYQQIAFHAQIKASSLDKERLIIQEEWRGKLSHRSRINDEKKALLRVGSLYPERPVIGTQASIKHTPADKLQAFYKDWYAPNNMALVLFSPMDVKALEAKIKRTFGDEPARVLPRRHPKDPELDDQLKIGQLNDAGSKVNRVAFLYRFKSELSHTDEGRRDGLIDYMTRNLLTQQIRRQRGVLPEHVRALSSTKGAVSPNVAILGFSVNVDEGFHAAGLQSLIQELVRINSQGFSQSDFDEVYEKVIETAKRNKTAAKSRGTIWSVKMVEAVTSDKIVHDPEESNNRILRLVESISLADVNARLGQWLSSSDRILYTQAVGGKDINLGTMKDVDGIFNRMKERHLAPLEIEQKVIERQLPKVAKTGSIALINRDETLGVSHWSLSNGDKLTLLDPRILAEKYDVVSSDESKHSSYFSAMSSAGYHVVKGSTWAEQIAVQMSQATGVYGWTAEEFQKWRTEQKVLLSSKQKAQSLAYRGAVDNGVFENLLNLYHVNQTLPNINADVYDRVMMSMKRNAGISVERPIEVFSKHLAVARFGDTDLAPTLSILEPLSLEALEALRQKQVALPVQYFIVSRLPEDEVTRLVSRYLASIPRDTAAYSESDYETTPVLQREGQLTVDVSLNTEPKAEYRLYAYDSVEWTPEAALQLTYLGERLETKLKQRLRSEVQGVYSVRVDLELNKDTDRAELKIQYSSSPARLDDLARMTEMVLLELSSMVTEEWTNDVYEAFIDVEKSRLNNAFDATLVHRIELSEVYFGDTSYLHNMEKLTSALTLNKLKLMAERLTFKDRVTGLYRPIVE